MHNFKKYLIAIVPSTFCLIAIIILASMIDLRASIQAGFPVLSRSGNTTGYVNFTGSLTGTSNPCLDGSGNLTISGCSSSGGNGLVTFSALSVVLSAGSAVFVPLGGGGLGSSTEANVQAKVQPVATFSNMCATLSAAPGGTDSITVTLRDGGADKAITVTITGSAKSACDSTHTFTNAAADLMNWSATPSAVLAAYTPNVMITVGIGTLTSGSVSTSTAFNLAQYATNGTTVSGVAVGDCPDTGGQHLNRASATGVWSCGTSGSGGATFTQPYVTSDSSNFYGPVFLFTKPTLTTFAWRNQGAATITATNGSLYLTSGAGTSAYNWKIREAAITVPYTLDITIMPGGNNDLQAIQNFFGVCLVESGSGKLISYGPGYTFPTTSVIEWTNVTTFNTQPYIKNYLGMNLLGGLTHLRITNDSTNRKYWYSLDHINFIEIYTEVTGTFITEDLAGPCVNTQGGATYNISETVYSYLVQ